jgi:hypothetical protein
VAVSKSIKREACLPRPSKKKSVHLKLCITVCIYTVYVISVANKKKIKRKQIKKTQVKRNESRYSVRPAMG